MSETVWPAGPEGPRESLACGGRADHRLQSTPLGLLQEETRCTVCGRVWTRRIRRVDPVRKEIVDFVDPTYVLQTATREARRPSNTRRGPGAIIPDEMPTNFRELEVSRREREEDLGLRRRRGRRS